MTRDSLTDLAEAIVDAVANHDGDIGDTFAIVAHRDSTGATIVQVRGYDASTGESRQLAYYARQEASENVFLMSANSSGPTFA